MNESYYDRIHQYLQNTMDPKERAAFELEMDQQPALREDVHTERLLLAGIEKAGEQAAREQIQSVHRQLKEEGWLEAVRPETPTFTIIFQQNMKRIISIAAALVALLGAVWFFNPKSDSVSPQALFQQYHQPQQELPRLRNILAQRESYGLAGNTDTLVQSLQLFEAGKYQECAQLLSAYRQEHPLDTTAQYYLGLTYLNAGNYAKAIELLQPISLAEQSDFKNDALWNLGLCYLQTTDGVKEAREVFTQLSQNNNYSNHRGAKALLEQLIPKD